MHGRFGWDVAVLQYLLNKHGVRVPLNAYMDRPTVAGMRRYQRRCTRRRRRRGSGDVHRARICRRTSRAFAPFAVDEAQAALHVVKPGDSLTAIARRTHTTLQRLCAPQPLEPRAHAAHRHQAAAAGSGQRVGRADGRLGVERTEVRASLDRWASFYGVDPSLARALAWMESGFNNSVVSSVGAQGVMQLLPSTWDYVEQSLIGHPVQHDADGNVQIGLAYLHHLLGAFGGNENLALAGWYQGERAVKLVGPYKVSKVFVADVLALRERM